jgi:hypothetical protein
MLKKVLLAVVALALFLPYGSFNQEKNNFFETKETTRFLKENEKSSNDIFKIVEEECKKKNSNPIIELENYIKGLEELKLNLNSNEELKKIQEQIDINKKHLNVLSQYYNGIQTYDVLTDTTITGVVTYFVAVGYDLSVELLNHAIAKPNEDSTYTPFFGGRVFANPKVVDIIESNSQQGSSFFEKDTGITVKDDLFYSLHNWSYTRVNDKRIRITDRYDYEKDSFDGLVGQIINIICDAHSNGELNYYNVEIDADYRELIPIEVLSKNNGKWNLKITNNSSSKRLIVYNGKMCNKADARNWTNLTDTESISLEENATSIISISENGSATHFALSYISLMTRHTTMADQISIGKNIGIESYETVCPYQSGYANLGKNNNSWLIQIKNPTNTPKTLEYNTKMCNEGDAKEWKNLNDIKTMQVSAFDYAIIRVYENYFATHIAARLLTDTSEQRLAIDGLDTMCNMNVNSKMYAYYKYLKIENKGKNGNKWKIKITNTLASSVTVNYNSKMCYEDDAKNWKNLSDIKSFTLSGNSNRTIEIQENWWATHIAISYVASDGRRLITYANNLNENGTIAISNNRI